MKTVDEYNEFISAEIPDPELHPRLHQYVEKHMIHGPCHLYKNCLRDGECTKYFPKKFNEVTHNTKSGYPTYRRRENGHTCRSVLNTDQIVDSQYVVPYNPGLLLKYNCHINVEICSTIQAIKYVYKYVYKGPDRAFISIGEKEDEASECDRFLNARSIGPSEACYRICGFPINGQHPPVTDLIIHLPDKQNVYYDENENYEDINLSNLQHSETQLLEYFANNLKEKTNPLTLEERGCFQDGSPRPHGYQLRYIDYPQFYTWQNKKWTRRSPRSNLRPTVGRMHYVNYKQRERYYLRVLLNKIPGATSFDHLKTVDGSVCETFREACCKLGILDDDEEWNNALQEACDGVITDGNQLRIFFATILNNNDINDPNALWQNHKDDLTSDIRYEYYKNRNVNYNEWEYTQQMYNECLFRIEEHLQSSPDKEGVLEDYGLPCPNRSERIVLDQQPVEIRRELDFDETLEKNTVRLNERLMRNNKQQLHAYKTIMRKIYQPTENEGNFLFLQASAGTGKTFLGRTIASNVRSRGDIALCCATSGIAANLYENGRTMHSRFKIPLNCQKHSPLTIKRQSALAQLIKKCKIIIWDEAPMAHKNVLFWLDLQLQDIMNVHKPFGGKVLLLCGDFKQLPPVTSKAGMAASIKTSHYFQRATVLKLVRNERLRRQLSQSNITAETKNDLIKFDKWINDIGYGRLPKKSDIHAQAISIDNSYISNSANLSEFIDETYQDMNQQNDDNYYKDRCILTTLNQTVREINQICLEKFETRINQRSLYENKIYESEDSVGLDDVGAMFSKEWLNEQEYNGVPLHKLRLKVGVPVILLRNINPAQGLCNGTRLIITELHDHVIKCKVMSNPSQIVHLPRMILSPSSQHISFEFKRRQFPISLAFAMTINKSQGQTLRYTSIYLPAPVFEHGQLYVAVSRVTCQKNLRIFLENDAKQGFINGEWITRNVVHTCLLV